jgi:SAM-dependent methyltransferase
MVAVAFGSYAQEIGVPETTSELVNYNATNRDNWVAGIAQQLPAGTRLLDVGAGPARYRSLFTHCQYMTQDFNQYMGTTTGVLKEDWSYTQTDFISDAASIPIAARSYDAVLCTEVLEHVPNPVQVLSEIGRILCPGGYAFISAPLGSGLHQQPYHFYGGFTPHFYRRFLPEAGLQVISIQPNGLFFRLFLQEMRRALSILQQHRHYPVWHPVRWIIHIAASYTVARWLTQLDEEIPVDEFTAGYHVIASKEN